MSGELELIACNPHPIESNGFNPNASLPYSCTIEYIHLAMNNFVEFLGLNLLSLIFKNLALARCSNPFKSYNLHLLHREINLWMSY